MKICRLSAADRKAFCALFAEYYQELGCDEDIDHLLDEYVLADFDAGLLDIAVAQEGGAAFGFVIWQTDRAENDWCLREGMGTVRELFVAPSFRGRGTSSALTAFAESDIAAAGVAHIYVLPAEGTGSFFIARGYAPSDEWCEDTGCYFFYKKL